MTDTEGTLGVFDLQAPTGGSTILARTNGCEIITDAADGTIWVWDTVARVAHRIDALRPVHQIATSLWHVPFEHGPGLEIPTDGLHILIERGAVRLLDLGDGPPVRVVGLTTAADVLADTVKAGDDTVAAIADAFVRSPVDLLTVTVPADSWQATIVTTRLEPERADEIRAAIPAPDAEWHQIEHSAIVDAVAGQIGQLWQTFHADPAPPFDLYGLYGHTGPLRILAPLGGFDSWELNPAATALTGQAIYGPAVIVTGQLAGRESAGAEWLAGVDADVAMMLRDFCCGFDPVGHG